LQHIKQKLNHETGNNLSELTKTTIIVKLETMTIKRDNEDEADKVKKPPPPTTYLETLMHLFKGNVGPGCYASESKHKIHYSSSNLPQL
jgi:hypothetical protein